MQSLTHSPFRSWYARVLQALLRRRAPSHAQDRSVSWQQMRSIDFEGEDTSLTEQDLLRMR